MRDRADCVDELTDVFCREPAELLPKKSVLVLQDDRNRDSDLEIALLEVPEQREGSAALRPKRGDKDVRVDNDALHHSMVLRTIPRSRARRTRKTFRCMIVLLGSAVALRSRRRRLP